MTDACLDDSKSYKQFTMKDAKIYFNNHTQRNWDDYSLLEMIDLLKLPDEGNISMVNIPDIIVCIASIKKNYDLYIIICIPISFLAIPPTSPSTFKFRTLKCHSLILSISALWVLTTSSHARETVIITPSCEKPFSKNTIPVLFLISLNCFGSMEFVPLFEISVD